MNDGEAEVETRTVTFPLEEQLTFEVVGKLKDGHVGFEEKVMMKELEEKTNINIEWTEWGDAVYAEKKSLMLTTGDMPDAIYGGWLLSGSEIVNYGEQGYFYPLNELIDAGVMPNFANVLEMRPEMRLQNTAPDGNIYAIPYVNEANAQYLAADAQVINTEWLEKVGKEMPTTTDELYDVLVAFKEAGDLNGNGLDDEIPLSFAYDASTSVEWRSLVGWFGVAPNDAMTPSVGEGGELFYAQTTDEFKDALVYFNKLYSEGLLDQEAFTLDSKTYNARNKTEPFSVGVLQTWTERYTDGGQGIYRYMAPLTSPNGNTPQVATSGFSYTGCGFVMNSECENPDELAAWADLLVSQEYAVKSFYAFPEYLEEVEPGKYRAITKEDGSGYVQTEMSWVSPGPSCLAMVLIPEYYDYYEYSEDDLNKLETNDIYGDYINTNGVYFSSWFTTQDEADELAILTVDIDSYVDQSVADFVTHGGIEEGWDAYVAQVEKLGLSRMLEIQQGIYDRNAVK